MYVVISEDITAIPFDQIYSYVRYSTLLIKIAITEIHIKIESSK